MGRPKIASNEKKETYPLYLTRQMIDYIDKYHINVKMLIKQELLRIHEVQQREKDDKDSLETLNMRVKRFLGEEIYENDAERATALKRWNDTHPDAELNELVIPALNLAPVAPEEDAER